MEKRVDNCTPFAVASVRILEQLHALESSYDKEKALLANYIITLKKPTEDFPMDTIVSLADRAVEYTGMTDDARFSSFEIAAALLHDRNIDHLDAVLAADDETFCQMVPAACLEVRDYYSDDGQPCERSFSQMAEEEEGPAPGGAKGQRRSVEPALSTDENSTEAFVLAAARAQSCLAELDDTLDRDRALVLNYALAMLRHSKRPKPDTGLLVKLAQRAVDFRYMVDDARFTEYDVVGSLLQDDYIEHLPTVLAAEDGAFLMLVIAACEEMREACEGDNYCLHREGTFAELVAAEKKAQEAPAEKVSFEVFWLDVYNEDGQWVENERHRLGKLDVVLPHGKEVDENAILAAMAKFNYQELTCRKLQALNTTDRQKVYAEDYYGDGNWWEVGTVEEHMPVYGLRLIEEDNSNRPEAFMPVDDVRKLPAGTAVTLVCEKGKRYQCMVLAPVYDDQLHLMKPDPKDNSAPLCFGMPYQGYGADWNILI